MMLVEDYGHLVTAKLATGFELLIMLLPKMLRKICRKFRVTNRAL
jgi:hypothetical protein